MVFVPNRTGCIVRNSLCKIEAGEPSEEVCFRQIIGYRYQYCIDPVLTRGVAQICVSARPNTYFLSDCSAVVLRSK